MSTIVIRSNTVTPDAPWRWLGQGFRDLGRIPIQGLLYGLVFALVSGGLAWGLASGGALAWLFPLAGGFLLVAPLLAMGLYEAARHLEQGHPPALGDMVFVRARSPLQLAYLGFGLMFIFLVWVNLARILYALSSYRTYTELSDFAAFALTTPQGLTMLVVGTLIGGGIAIVAFAAAAVSAPMLMHRETDVFTAIATSVRTCLDNKPAMLLWAGLIAALTAVGIVTLFLGLIVVFPWIGLATWHAYRDLVPQETPA